MRLQLKTDLRFSETKVQTHLIIFSEYCCDTFNQNDANITYNYIGFLQRLEHNENT